MSLNHVSSSSRKPYRPLVESQTYLDSNRRQSCLATRDPESLVEDLHHHTLTQIRLADQWTQDPVLLTTLHSSHIGIQSDPDDPESPTIYPEGPLSVYRFMRSPDGEIHGTWDRTGHYHPESKNIGCKPPWSMDDVPDSIIMKAAAKVSIDLRGKWTPVICDGTTSGCMNEMINTFAEGDHKPSKMFLHVMAAEVAACREYLTNKAIRSSLADVESESETNVEIELSHQAINHFFHGLDVLTIRRATPEAPDRAPHTAICSDEFVKEVVPNYFDRWDGYEAETQAHDRSHYQYLLTLNSQYGSIRGLREAMNRAAGAEARPTRIWSRKSRSHMPMSASTRRGLRESMCRDRRTRAYPRGQTGCRDWPRRCERAAKRQKPRPRAE